MGHDLALACTGWSGSFTKLLWLTPSLGAGGLVILGVPWWAEFLATVREAGFVSDQTCDHAGTVF